MRHALALALLLLAGAAFAQEGTDVAATPEPAETAARRLGIRLQTGEDMVIRSDAFEAARAQDGAERVIFEHDVRVVQGTLRIDCDWLEAIYPSGAQGQADRITARGGVKILQDATEARCTEAVFDNAEQTLLCTASTGKAELHRDQDILRADRIHFDLKTGKFSARGGVEVEMRSNGVAE